MSATVLIAGVGNVFFGDDGFGVEVARRLCAEALPADVEVVDYGIGGIHLAFRLLDPLRLLVVVDVSPRGGAPGTLYVIEPEVEDAAAGAGGEAHGMHVPAVLATARGMGAILPPVRIVACEPLDVAERIGLSTPVAAAVEPAARLVRELIEAERFRTAPSAATQAEVAP
jgi:hydrogenase maturation protease